MNVLSDQFEMEDNVYTLTEYGGVLFTTDHKTLLSYKGTLTKPFERIKSEDRDKVLTYSLGRYDKDDEVSLRDVALDGRYISWSIMEPFTFDDSYGSVHCNVMGDVLQVIASNDCPTNHLPTIEQVDMELLFHLFQGIPPLEMELQIARYHYYDIDESHDPDFDCIELMVANGEVTRDGVEAYERFIELLN
jgi:hypothetical protein